MKRKPTSRIRQLLQANRTIWDRPGSRATVLNNFTRVLACRTLQLGAEVFVTSTGEQQIVPHTCKSRACSSCGYWQTMKWQREAATQLPDVPCSGMVFSMRSCFWEIFRYNRSWLQGVATLGAGVLQDWHLNATVLRFRSWS
jgi:Transposase zinc-binding domain